MDAHEFARELFRFSEELSQSVTVADTALTLAREMHRQVKVRYTTLLVYACLSFCERFLEDNDWQTRGELRWYRRETGINCYVLHRRCLPIFSTTMVTSSFGYLLGRFVETPAQHGIALVFLAYFRGNPAFENVSPFTVLLAMKLLHRRKKRDTRLDEAMRRRTFKNLILFIARKARCASSQAIKLYLKARGPVRVFEE